MVRGDIFLNRKEARRVYVMEQVLQGNLTIRQAAEMLQLSERQVKRLKKGMKQEGVAALAHKNRGRTPKHTISKDIKDMVCSLATSIYKGASANHMAELLAENHRIKISAKSVIRILRSAGIIPEPKKQRRYRRARDRAPQEGLLVQIDASPCNWLEDRGPGLSLHGAIDDATGKVLGLYFRPEEDLRGYFEVLMQVVRQNGVPRCVYSDRHTIFVSPNKDKLTIEEELEGKTVNLTQFGTALNELGISHIQARSPQAKGRIERLWGTLQSRLIVELRAAGISTLEEANAFLPKFIERFNQRFAVQPADPIPAYMPKPSDEMLRNIIAFRETRSVSNDSLITFHGSKYRLVNAEGRIIGLVPRSRVTILTRLDGSTRCIYQGQVYSLQEFKPEPKVAHERPRAAAQRGHKPSPDHPWVRFPLRKPEDPNPISDYFSGHANKHLDPSAALNSWKHRGS